MSMSLCLSPMTWLPDLRPAFTVADCPPGVEARQNEDRPLGSGTGRRWRARGTGLSQAHPPTVDPVPETRGHDEPTDRQHGRSGGGCSSRLLLRHLGSSLIYIPRRPSRRRQATVRLGVNDAMVNRLESTPTVSPIAWRQGVVRRAREPLNLIGRQGSRLGAQPARQVRVVYDMDTTCARSSFNALVHEAENRNSLKAMAIQVGRQRGLNHLRELQRPSNDFGVVSTADLQATIHNL